MPNLSSRDQTLKRLVFDLNEFIKKSKKLGQNPKDTFLEDLVRQSPCKLQEGNKENQCDGFYLDFSRGGFLAPYQYDCICSYLKKRYSQKITSFFIKKLESHWPLKRGMVDSKTIAWQNVHTSYEAVQASIAFMIKCIAVEKYRSELSLKEHNSRFPQTMRKNDDIFNYFSFLFSFEEVFLNRNVKLFFWNDIKLIYQSYYNSEVLKNRDRQVFVRNELPRKCVVVLCFEETFFRLRSGTNVELFAFEQFLNDLISADNSLVVFSTQKLIQESEKNTGFYQNYSVSYKRNLDELKISLQQAMEPDFKIARDERFIEPNRVGSFDRLIELLSNGQNYIKAVEKDFAEWKIKTEN